MIRIFAAFLFTFFLVAFAIKASAETSHSTSPGLEAGPSIESQFLKSFKNTLDTQFDLFALHPAPWRWQVALRHFAIERGEMPIADSIEAERMQRPYEISAAALIEEAKKSVEYAPSAVDVPLLVLKPEIDNALRLLNQWRAEKASSSQIRKQAARSMLLNSGLNYSLKLIETDKDKKYSVNKLLDDLIRSLKQNRADIKSTPGIALKFQPFGSIRRADRNTAQLSD